MLPVKVIKEDPNSVKASDLRRRFPSTNKANPTRWRELAYDLMTNKAYVQVCLVLALANVLWLMILSPG